MTDTVTSTVRPGRRVSVGPVVPLVPFFLFTFVFLMVPTLTVIVGAFQAEDGTFSLGNIDGLWSRSAVRALRGSLIVSSVSAVIGAVVGAILSYIVASARPASILRRTIVAVSGVLAQFGGVTLAFAFIATYSYAGVLTLALRNGPGIETFSQPWLYELSGLTFVYVYFQVPLMVIVFLPAMEGIRPQWREAAVNLGATGRQYWTQVAFPLLRPAFLGSTLLLFANAFAAYATAAALITQGTLISPLLIRAALISETRVGQEKLGYALALEMIVIVALVMSAYALLLRRTARWLR